MPIPTPKGPDRTPEPGKYPKVHGNLEDSPYESELNRQRREHVKSMMQRAFKGYADYAWGENELMPITRQGHSAGIFGGTRMGATIIDALDTLYIMGLDDEFKKARDWVATSLSFNVGASVSVFEINIRFVGGLLSAYSMTGDKVFLEKALDCAKRLLPAFNTRTGVPHSLVNLMSGASSNYGWAAGGCSILSELGTMELEFDYLTRASGDPVFSEKARNAMQQAINHKTESGLYYNYFNADNGGWCSSDVSIGALGDSFYEYLLKYWVYTGGQQANAVSDRKVYDDAMKAFKDHLILRSQPSNLLYFAEGHGTSPINKMGHLACFVGGLLALGSINAPTEELAQWYLKSGAEITHTCHEGYHRSPTGFAPESMQFDGGNEATSNNGGDRYYILRPEVVESYFVLWRMTHDNKYREWAWEAVEALEKHCRCGVAYCGLRDVNVVPAQQDDVQQSFFLAETLKYLYLTFTDDETIALDKWVLNTEAHPLPVFPRK
eukprot:m.158248 g.158248  ORF g.158248 m.158248 type:complete len:494 (+) comp17014_c0_seq1:645-2126(+)